MTHKARMKSTIRGQETKFWRNVFSVALCVRTCGVFTLCVDRQTDRQTDTPVAAIYIFIIFRNVFLMYLCGLIEEAYGTRPGRKKFV